MTLTFLGTGASPSAPIIHCRCPHCEAARRLGGPNLRKRSAVLVDDDLLIDLGPDIISSSFMHGIPLDNLRHCLQTHPHSDHLDISHLLSRHPEYAVEDVPPWDLYCSSATLKGMDAQFQAACQYGSLCEERVCRDLKLTIHRIKPLQAFDVGNKRVTAFAANHAPPVEPLIYAIERDGKSMLYATDTAALPEETWQGFIRLKLCFDLVVLDHTYGPGCGGTDHLNANMFAEHVDRMRREGLLRPNARIFATHISHEGNPDHASFSDLARGRGYEMAYDGLRFII